MRRLSILTAVFLMSGWTVPFGAAAAERGADTLIASWLDRDSRKPDVEDYIREDMPPGFQVIVTELEGAVFADAAGRTLYRWPSEATGTPNCYDVQYRVTAGGKVRTIYPAGNEVPDADTRPTCVQHWPPVLAAAGATPVGKWSVLDRTDGAKQWAYEGYALYTSHLDRRPGDTNGGSFDRKGRDVSVDGGEREPVGPPPAVPAQFGVISKALGRQLVSAAGYAVYAFDGDTATASTCNGACLDRWTPVLAPEAAVARGAWSVIRRQGGGMQWAFRGKPLYTHNADSVTRSYEGSDVPGWRNVFTQRTPRPPRGFQVVDTRGGQVLADARGRTIYYYSCVEDTEDTLMCDTPDASQAYRWIVCGGGDPARCLKTFPYVTADKDAKSDSMAWSVITIDPQTGRVVDPTAPSLRVWAYRGRPLYNMSYDREPGDIEGDSWGQDHGEHNGFTAFWVRDAFRGNRVEGLD